MGIIGRIKRRISDHKHGPMYVKDFPIPYLKPKGKIYPLSTKKAKSPEGIPVNREFKFLRFEEHIPSDCEVYGFSAPYYLKSKPSDVKLGKTRKIASYKDEKLHVKVKVVETYYDRRKTYDRIQKLNKHLKNAGLIIKVGNCILREMCFHDDPAKLVGYELVFKRDHDKNLTVEQVLLRLLKSLGLKKVKLYPYDEPDCDCTPYDCEVNKLNLFDHDVRFVGFNLDGKDFDFEFGHYMHEDFIQFSCKLLDNIK